MQITPRTLLASVAASGVFGGMAGALATSATASQANPQAIAAAVQKVQDRAAEKYLRFIGTELLPMSSLEGGLKRLQENSDNIRKNTYNVCWDTASVNQRPSCVP